MRLRGVVFTAVLLMLVPGCTGYGREGTPSVGLKSRDGRSPAAEGGRLDPSLEPNYGKVVLVPGPLSGSVSVRVASGGQVDVAGMDLGEECRGYATSAPDYRLLVAEGFESVRIIYIPLPPGGDTTLVVGGPDSEWLCNDDHGEGPEPMVELSPAEPGRYDIWVGGHSPGENLEGTLIVTDSDLTPGFLTNPGNPDRYPDSDGLDWSIDPGFGEAELHPGFLPDPYTLDLVTVGYYGVRQLELGTGCSGYTDVPPDLGLDLTDYFSQLRILFVADEEGSDTTLLVRTPDGDWICNDDYDREPDPMVELSGAEAGRYHVWVGSYKAAQHIAGTLYITEQEATPADYR